MSKKQLPILYSNLLYKMGNYCLDIQQLLPILAQWNVLWPLFLCYIDYKVLLSFTKFVSVKNSLWFDYKERERYGGKEIKISLSQGKNGEKFLPVLRIQILFSEKKVPDLYFPIIRIRKKCETVNSKQRQHFYNVNLFSFLP